jgi:hypothetical protein
MGEYCKTVYEAAMRNYQNLFTEDGIYHGKEGCLRLARDYGTGLADMPPEAAKDDLHSSYSVLCVRAYLLRPPIDAKEWANEAQKAMERARRKRACT